MDSAEQHRDLCAAHKKVSASHLGSDDKSVVRLLMDASWRHHRENQVENDRQPAAVVDDAPLLLSKPLRSLNLDSDDDRPLLPHDTIPVEASWTDLVRLQSHLEEWPEENRLDWKKAVQVAERMLGLVGLTLPTETISAFDFISIIESNAFGIYSETGAMMGRGNYSLGNGGGCVCVW